MACVASVAIMAKRDVSDNPDLTYALANVVKSCASAWSNAANAHAVLARFCGLKSPTCRSASFAKATNSRASAWPNVANAHAVLASSYGLESSRRRSASCAKAASNRASARPKVANAHAARRGPPQPLRALAAPAARTRSHGVRTRTFVHSLFGA